jgi:response regulator NasT
MDLTQRLRVLIANERPDRLELLGAVIAGLGHEVVAGETNVEAVGAATARARPDVALVGLSEDSEHALDLISAIVRESFCPVIALLGSHDGAFIEQAAQRGVFAYIVDSSPEEMQGAIDVTLRRFTEHAHLQGAFKQRNNEEERRAEITQLRQRQVLELHDGVVQQLTIASLALERDQHQKTREALLIALENARSVVSQSLADLQNEGVPLAQLIRDATPR